jgi:hypothetical protein
MTERSEVIIGLSPPRQGASSLPGHGATRRRPGGASGSEEAS